MIEVILMVLNFYVIYLDLIWFDIFISGSQPRKWGKLIQAASGGIIGNGNKRSSVDNTSGLPLSADNSGIR